MSYFKHTGVLGMRWGHRKQEERSSSSRITALKKGEEAGHISGNPNLVLKDSHLYISSDKRDILTYRANYSDQLRAMQNIDKVFSYKLEATKNLVSPDKKKRINEFIALAKDDKSVLPRMAESYYTCGLFLQAVRYLGLGSNEKKAAHFRQLINSKNPSDKEKAFLQFSKFLALKDDTNRKKYFKRLAKEGYNSVYDDNDISGGYKSKSSLIVFNPSKTLRITRKETDTEKDTERYYQEWERLEEQSKR